MAQIVEEVQGLYAIYPAWLVSACLAIVGLGLAYLLYRLLRVGMVVVVTVLLAAIVGFAGWMILAS